MGHASALDIPGLLFRSIQRVFGFCPFSLVDILGHSPRLHDAKGGGEKMKLGNSFLLTETNYE